MSFILDALKKSEGDRQRQAGPALFEVRVAPPRPRFPVWTLVLAVLLGVNALVFAGWMMVRATRPVAITVAAAESATGVPPVAVTRVIPAAPGAPLAAGNAPPVAEPAGAASSPAAPGPVSAPTRMPSAPRDPELAALDAATPPVAASADEEPAVEAPPAGRGAVPPVRTRSEGLPTRDEVHSPAVAGLPELRLDLLVYDADPARRFVMINMHRLREGDALPEGVRVDRITEEGAEVEYQGTRFLLPHE